MSQLEEEFVHEIAIKLSRVLNIINPNDLLATRVIEIAKNNGHDAFIKGGEKFLRYLCEVAQAQSTQLLKHLASFRNRFFLNSTPKLPLALRSSSSFKPLSHLMPQGWWLA